MRIHILPGDALLETFRAAGIEGGILMSRECLIGGPVAAGSPEAFWKMRAGYLAAEYGAEKERYYEEVAGEYEKISRLAPETEICLWFEYDLFCQVNLWFVLSLLSRNGSRNVYRVEPAVRGSGDLWRGFGDLSKDHLRECFERRVKLTQEDTLLGSELWEAYRTSDLARLEDLSKSRRPGFSHLREACEAEIERKKSSRPEKALQALLDEGLTDFKTVFRRFSEKEGVYGFGDLQVEAMLRRLVSSREEDA